MGVAALISWFVTAFVGLYLLAVWLIENDVKHRGAASRLPAPVISGHVLLALTGLTVWVLHLLSGSAAWGWAALGILAAEASAGTAAEFDFPAERAFPVSVVVGHGVLAATTLTLVLLALLGVG